MCGGELASARLLLVDDDACLAGLLAQFFELRGLHVRTCSDGGAALDAAVGWPAEIVLLDLEVSGMDGWEVCRLLRRALRFAPILIRSEYDTAQHIAQSHRAGADDHISKHTALAVLEAKVMRAAERACISESNHAGGLADGIPRDSGAPPESTSRVSGIRDLLGLSKRAAVGLHIDGLELTRIEEHLLSRLIFAAGTPVAREDLVEEAWGWRATAHGPLHQSISRLRRKLEELGWSIRNVRGVGYQLEQPARTRGRE